MESDFDGYMRNAWAEIRSRTQNRKSIKKLFTADPQVKYAAEFFDYFKAHPDSETGHKAAQGAFMMWGNLGKVEEIDKALPHIGTDSEVWRLIMHGVGNAYLRLGRTEDLRALVLGLLDKVTHSGSRSQLFMVLADLHYNELEKARPYHEEVIRLDAHPFDMQKANSALYELDTLQIGSVAPGLSLTTIKGLSFVLEELRGKVVLIEFWSRTCGPCLPDIPRLKHLYETLSSQEFQLLGVTDDRNEEELMAFMEEKGMEWPQVKESVEWEDERLVLGPARTKYNVFRIPRSFIIDRAGNLVAKDLRGEALEARTKQAVGV